MYLYTNISMVKCKKICYQHTILDFSTKFLLYYMLEIFEYLCVGATTLRQFICISHISNWTIGTLIFVKRMQLLICQIF